jgi:uncharacterized protein YjbI with pentapeptide repeats
MKKVYNTFLSKIFLLFLFFLFAEFLISSCSKLGGTETLSHFSALPDTANIYKLANFLSDEEREKIINEPNLLQDQKVRYNGIIPVPQDKDDFRRALLDNVYWRGVSVKEGDFRGATFRSANCSDSDFSNSDFRVADIRWTKFNNSKLINSNFSQAKMFHVHVNNADLSNCDFRGTNMFGMEGHDAILKQSNFSGALMKDTEFLYANFTGSIAVKAKMIRAVLKNSIVDSCDFSYVDLTGAGLGNVKFRHSRFHYTNFQGSHLQGADFTGADLKGCRFFEANFENTIFKDAINIPDDVQDLIVDGIANSKNIKH